jgi:nucleotide sugar dehydrogenase
MIGFNNDKILIVDDTISIDELFRKLSFVSKSNFFPGVAIILNTGKLSSVVTDGDIRRAYSKNIDFSLSVNEIMSSNPFFIYENQLANLSKEKISEFFNRKPKFIPILNLNNEVVDVLDYDNVLNTIPGDDFNVVVYGLGFVGLTLSIVIADNEMEVVGVDKNISLISDLNNCKSHIKEPGLNQILESRLNKNIFFHNSFLNHDLNKKTIYIISVGTPLKNDNSPDLSAIISVLDSICSSISKGDLVMLRSTVPLGTTRKVVIPYIEKNTNLKVGLDFFVAFTPERTIEGNALNELKSLPQIVGGYSKKCLLEARNFWSKISKTIVSVNSLEAAEMVKLINNTFRDVSFSFANEVALKCDEFNINCFELIKAANEGYPRNKISLPSPGVGGYCLTKDPYLFSYNSKLPFKSLGEKSREINLHAANYPLKKFNEYIKIQNFNTSKLKVLVLGLTFKGWPENNDTRGSVSVDIYNELVTSKFDVELFDFSLQKESQNEFKLVKSLFKSISNFDAIFIMNNHPENVTIENEIMTHNKPLFLFDGWNLINRNQISMNKNVTYCTMGYASKK